LNFIDDYELPSREETQVIDLVELNNHVYLSTLDGFFKVPRKKIVVDQQPHVNLFAVKVGGRILDPKNKRNLSYSENYIQFVMGVPAYNHPKDVYIKYGLIKGSDSTWFTSEPGERIIDFVSLSPGKYEFIASAVDPKLKNSDHSVNYHFVILPPWWQRAWFKVVVFVCLSLLVL
jgi:hypothetical protein